jgi:hypothetical protein
MATVNLGDFLRRLTRGMAAESLTDHSDRQLVERAMAGRDEAAFQAIARAPPPTAASVFSCSIPIGWPTPPASGLPGSKEPAAAAICREAGSARHREPCETPPT